jgi:hypothetical protein
LTVAFANVDVELRSPEDGSLFDFAPDCRDQTPRSCRGLILVDSAAAPPVRGGYVAFHITNRGLVDLGDVWVTLGGFDDEDAPGNLVRIAGGEAENPADPQEQWYASYGLGPLAAGASGTVFFYLEVTDPTSFVTLGAESRPDLTVWDGLPFLGSVVPANPALPDCQSNLNRACSHSSGAVEWPFIATETLTTFVNRVLQITQPTDTPVVGTRLEVTVVGQSGQVGLSADYDHDGDLDAFTGFSPSAQVSWPSKPLRMTGSVITFSGGNACGLADCSCVTDPPAFGECDFVRQDGRPPACELRTVPATQESTCVVLETTDSLQPILEDSISVDYVASYEFRVTRPHPVEVLGPIQFLTSGVQIKHTDISLEDCLNPEAELDPEGSGCCQLPEIYCIGPLLADQIGLAMERGPAPGEVTLHWNGAEPPFEVFRSFDPADLLRPERKIAETLEPDYVDLPPVSEVLFYKVGGACYPVPEVCNGEDDDCDGLSDEEGVCDTCINGLQDTDETDVDCGGSCPGCVQDQDCLSHSDCASNYCNPTTFTCAPKPCSSGAECQSGFCVDSFCCDSSCANSCDACDVAGSEGSCSVVPSGLLGAPSCSPYLCDGASVSCPFSCASNADCTSGFICNGSNQCVQAQPIGSVCSQSSECISGFCVDDYCCDSSCSNSCDACNMAGSVGSCSVVPSGLLGAPSCSPYLCDGATVSCPFSCASNADCISSFICNGSNQCVSL